MHCPVCGNPIESESCEEHEYACQVCGSSIRLEVHSTLSMDDRKHDPVVNGLPPDIPSTIGRFRVVERVGAGGFGVVFRAEDPDLQRTVALKVPHVRRVADRVERRRFVQEAQHLARLKHPNIVPVYEVGEVDGIPFLVTEFLEGETLAERLASRRPSLTEAVELCIDVARALHHAHGMGIIHRDVKPGNIMFDRLGNVHLMDFGLAKQDADNITMSASGEILGTPAYMSPEQAIGDAHHVDRRTDVYSLGVVLYELITGERPFRGNTHMIIQQVIHDEPRRPRRLNDRIPRDLEMICLRAMNKEPGQRYDSALDLAEDLARFLRHEPVKARPTALVNRFWLWCRRPERIREASIITIAMASMLALWECQGLVFLAVGLLKIPDTIMAVATMTSGVFFFSVIAALGWFARSRTVVVLWGGAACSVILLVFSGLCLLGYVAIPGLTLPEVRVPVFGFFCIAAAFIVLTHAVSLVAFYANRTTMGWSRRGFPGTPQSHS